MSKVHFQHISLEDAAAEIAAMEEMRDLISALNLEDVFPYSFFYLVWEANKVSQRSDDRIGSVKKERKKIKSDVT